MPLVAGSSVILPDAADMALAYTATVTPTDPPAGVNVVYTTTGAYYEVVESVFFQVAAGPAVGNRFALLVVHDASGNTVGIYPAPAAQTAGTTIGYTYAVGAATATPGAQANQTIQLPTIALQSGWTVAVGLQAFLDPADNVNTPLLLVQRYPTSGTSLVAPEPASIPSPIPT